jgi:WD40 repeat protein
LLPDGRRADNSNLSAYSGRAQLWHALTGEPIGPPIPHGQPITTVAFSPVGQLFVTGSQDGDARVWDTATRKQVGPVLRHNGSVRSIRFSPDGKTLLVATGSATLGLYYLWDVPSLTAEVERIVRWVQVLARQELDAEGMPHDLDDAAVQERRRRLEELGGPPLH